MPGIEALRKLQIGIESTGAIGTAVPATTKLRMLGSIQDNTEIVFPDENVGLMMGADRTYVASKGAEINLTGECTFEQLPIICSMAILDDEDGAVVASDLYTYTFTFPTTAANAFHTYTIEAGDNTEAHEVEYCFCSEFTISGEPNQAWMLDATIIGRQASTTSFTDLAAVWPDVKEISFNRTKLYIDAVTTFPATTQKANTLMGFDFNYNTGIIPVFSGGGYYYFDYAKMTRPEVTLQVTFEYDGTATAEMDAWRAQTSRSIRLQGISADTYDDGTQIANIDILGRWESFDVIDSVDGNDVVTGTLKGRYVSAASSAGQIIVITKVANIPSAT